MKKPKKPLKNKKIITNLGEQNIDELNYSNLITDEDPSPAGYPFIDENNSETSNDLNIEEGKEEVNKISYGI